jgi:hypothetical protein
MNLEAQNHSKFGLDLMPESNQLTLAAHQSILVNMVLFDLLIYL